MYVKSDKKVAALFVNLNYFMAFMVQKFFTSRKLHTHNPKRPTVKIKIIPLCPL
jgi:hypothetical protein